MVYYLFVIKPEHYEEYNGDTYSCMSEFFIACFIWSFVSVLRCNYIYSIFMETAKLYTNFFNDILELYPSMGAYLGYRQYDDRYENYCSKQIEEAWKHLVVGYLKKASHVRDESLQAKAFIWFLKSEKQRLDDVNRLFPISSYDNEIISMIFNNKTFYPLKTKHDLRNLIKRYYDMIEILKTCISSMKEGIVKGVVLPVIICQAMLRDLKAFHRNKDYIIQLPTHLSSSSSPEYRAVLDLYATTLSSLISFIEHEYLAKCRKTLGMCYLPNGKKHYEKLLIAKTTLNVKPDEVYKYGCEEVKRLRGEFDQLRQELGYSQLNHLQFCKRIIDDPKYYAKTVPELMTYYETQKKRVVDTVMKDNFHTPLKTNYEIKAVPKDMEESAAGAFYYAGNYKKGRGVFYVNTRDLRENPLYSAYVLSLHEGQPGHHYQFQYMIEKNIPESGVFAFSAEGFVEGWALYVENLGKYTPIERFGKLSYEMLRAVRLVVDVGVHYYGWTWAKALKYMVANVPVQKSELESELMRYICIPGQACSYKMGERLFKQLGEAFVKSGVGKIKDYHEAVLETGVVPLEVLKEYFKTRYGVK